MVKEQFLALQLKISHCDMPTTSSCGGPQPPQLAPKSCKKLKKSHPRRLHGHLAVPPLKQAQNLAQEQFLALQLKISHCDMPATSPCGGPQPPQLPPKSWKKQKNRTQDICMDIWQCHHQNKHKIWLRSNFWPFS